MYILTVHCHFLHQLIHILYVAEHCFKLDPARPDHLVLCLKKAWTDRHDSISLSFFFLTGSYFCQECPIRRWGNLGQCWHFLDGRAGARQCQKLNSTGFIIEMWNFFPGWIQRKVFSADGTQLYGLRYHNERYTCFLTGQIQFLGCRDVLREFIFRLKGGSEDVYF